jgi:hypothetical protein
VNPSHYVTPTLQLLSVTTPAVNIRTMFNLQESTNDKIALLPRDENQQKEKKAGKRTKVDAKAAKEATKAAASIQKQVLFVEV